MAKPMKKKSLIKKAVKAVAKIVKKPAAKPMAKATGKNASKSASKPAKKLVAKPIPAKKAPVKAAKKAAAKKAAPAKSVKKVVAAPRKNEKPPKEVKETKAAKVIPAVVEKVEKVSKKETKANAKKAGKTGKKDEDEVEDDFISDDDLAHDDLGEYEEELKEVESLDDETEEVVEWSAETKEKGDEEIYLTDADGRRYCRARDCDQAAVSDIYCRYHYLLFWRKIQVRKRILVDGKLEKYIEELTDRYSDKFLEMIRRDLRTEKDFVSAIQELEIDESALDNDQEEDTQTFIDEVRGMGESSGSGVEDEEF